MSCFNGCFGWLQGSPKPVEKNQVESQLTNLKASEEENGNSRQGSKGFKTESGRFQTESGRFHYSVTGMQLPESPQRRSSKGVKYSNTGMPLYDEGDANITPPMRKPSNSAKWSEKSASGKWAANSNSGGGFFARQNSASQNELKRQVSTSESKNKWTANANNQNGSSKHFSLTGMPMPEPDEKKKASLKKMYSNTGMPLQ